MRRRMGDNALQNKPPCRMTGSKKGVRFTVTPPLYAVLCCQLGRLRLAVYLNHFVQQGTHNLSRIIWLLILQRTLYKLILGVRCSAR